MYLEVLKDQWGQLDLVDQMSPLILLILDLLLNLVSQVILVDPVFLSVLSALLALEVLHHLVRLDYQVYQVYHLDPLIQKVLDYLGNRTDLILQVVLVVLLDLLPQHFHLFLKIQVHLVAL